MKKGILFDMIRENGGSFQMSVNNLITLTNNFKKKKIQFVILTQKKNLELKNLNLKYKIIKLSISDYLFLIISNISIFKNLLYKFNVSSSFERKLIKNT